MLSSIWTAKQSQWLHYFDWRPASIVWTCIYCMIALLTDLHNQVKECHRDFPSFRVVMGKMNLCSFCIMAQKYTLDIARTRSKLLFGRGSVFLFWRISVQKSRNNDHEVTMTVRFYPMMDPCMVYLTYLHIITYIFQKKGNQICNMPYMDPMRMLRSDLFFTNSQARDRMAGQPVGEPTGVRV